MKTMQDSRFPTDTASQNLYRAGGCTAVLFFVYSVVTILIFALIHEGYPETALECFMMLQENVFIGLLRLDIVSILVIPFYYLLFFSLYHALKEEYELPAKIALFCVLAGVTVFIAGLNLIELTTLSRKYHATADPQRQQQLLAAGECLLAGDMCFSTGAKIRGILIEFGALVFSLMMLKTRIFSKFCGWVGILAHGFDLSSEILSIGFPVVKQIFTMLAGPLYLIWFIAIARRLFRLGAQKDA